MKRDNSPPTFNDGGDIMIFESKHKPPRFSNQAVDLNDNEIEEKRSRKNESEDGEVKHIRNNSAALEVEDLDDEIQWPTQRM